MTDTGLDVVTGAFSYTGGYIARRLLEAGRRVRTLTRSAAQADDAIEARPLDFAEPARLEADLRGATTLYNTYWVRFERGATTFDAAVANSTTLFEAARRAGVQRIVHISITNPSRRSPLPYFRGKARVEEALVATGIPHAIVRPTVLFGGRDVLVNNIAFLLRRSPVFAIAGDGSYRLRPVHVDDVARICVERAPDAGAAVIDAVGPETFGFREFVDAIARAVHSRARVVNVPPDVVVLLAHAAGRVLGDVLLTSDELAGLMAEMITTDTPTTGRIAFSDWLSAHGDALGRRYTSELRRNFTPA